MKLRRRIRRAVFVPLAVVVGLLVALTAGGCGGVLVASMSARERHVVCTTGGRRPSSGEPYPARIRVPACLKAADEERDEAARRNLRIRACDMSNRELARPPEGMTLADCANEKAARVEADKQEQASVERASAASATIEPVPSLSDSTVKEQADVLAAQAKLDADRQSKENKKKQELEISALAAQCADGKKLACKQADFYRNKMKCDERDGVSCFALANEMQRRINECGPGRSQNSDIWCPFGAEDLSLSSRRLFLQNACDLHHKPACDALPHADALVDQAEEDEATRQTVANTQQQEAVEAKVLSALKSRCGNGDRGACMLMNFTVQCKSGNSSACDSAGNAYLGGVGTNKDIEKTKTYWMKACRMDASKCAGYGIKFYNSRATSGAPEVADEFFDQGCNGSASQCATIGAIIMKGAGGVPQDSAKAHAFFDRGCKANDATSCQLLNRR